MFQFYNFHLFYLITGLFAKIFCFLICFKIICSCLLKYFRDGCFTALSDSPSIWLIQCWCPWAVFLFRLWISWYDSSFKKCSRHSLESVLRGLNPIWSFCFSSTPWPTRVGGGWDDTLVFRAVALLFWPVVFMLPLELPLHSAGAVRRGRGDCPGCPELVGGLWERIDWPHGMENTSRDLVAARFLFNLCQFPCGG